MTMTTPSSFASTSPAVAATVHAVPVAPSTGALRPLGLDEVRITGGIWADRQRVNGTATLDHIEHWLDREGWLANYDLAVAGGLAEGRRGREFSDSEVYKYLEAVAWEIGRLRAAGADAAGATSSTGEADAAASLARLEGRFRATVARIAAAQEPDGYLNTRFGRPGQEPRWSDLEWGHELYCLGHLFQAAVARVRTAPGADDGLVGVARRAADLVCETFGEGGLERICGHAEVEVGLAELGRALGEPRYLEQARLFVERHGRGTLRDIEWGRAYYQDDAAVREADALRGHSVRANYLAAGAMDVAVETADADLSAALERQWDRTRERRTYVTGGQGSHHQDEAFGEDWELPSDRAYSETCAGVASVMFSWRLLLANGDVRHADLIERTLFNVIETSPDAAGTAFYYANTLHQRVPGAPADPDVVSPRAHSSLRAPWFDVSCCPPNTARTFASLAAYLATADDAGVQLHQYAPSIVRTVLADGREVSFEVLTEYPRSGTVRVRALSDAASPWRLSLRVPSWAVGARLSVRSASGEIEQQWPAAPGMVSVERRFAAGDEVELELPMAPRFVAPDPRVDAVRGCLVVERGPEVYALESVDLADTALAASDFADLRVDPDIAPIDTGDGRVVVRLTDRRTDAAADVALVPYHAWAERGPSTMRVWVPAVGG
ncbi:glycoside hydrolase family 127 protein [Agromyces sp. Marseille-Q5079]|uniref:glycoside hydrolase family 127 protein n=1 Tax=Agromyces sp. Marseille-Q5079 TaxID=3439059 RepID=UPI003D9C859E